MPDLTDRQIVLLYREWSEDFYAASFMSLNAEGLDRFVEWLEQDEPLKDYEHELVRQYRELAENATFTASPMDNIT